jgi:hypothetical protein
MRGLDARITAVPRRSRRQTAAMKRPEATIGRCIHY